MSIVAIITVIDAQLDKLLANRTLDEASLNGVLNFGHSNLLPVFHARLVSDLQKLEAAPGSTSAAATAAAAAGDSNSNSGDLSFSAINVIDYVWTSMHYKVVRYFHLQFAALKEEQLGVSGKKGAKNKKAKNFHGLFVRLFNSYKKANKSIVGFYYDVVKHVIEHYNIKAYLPESFAAVYNLGEQMRKSPPGALVLDPEQFALLKFMLEKITFVNGVCSRYRTFFSLYVLSASTRKEPSRLDTFDKAIAYFELCIALQPGSADAFYEIGNICNLYGRQLQKNSVKSIADSFNQLPFTAYPHFGDQFHAVYYFVRSFNTANGHDAAFAALVKILVKVDPVTGEPNELVEHYKSLYTTLVRRSKEAGRSLEKITKLQFLLLVSWHLFGEKMSLLSELLDDLKMSIYTFKNHYYENLQSDMAFTSKNIEILEKTLIILMGLFNYCLAKYEDSHKIKFQDFNSLPSDLQNLLTFTFECIVALLNIMVSKCEVVPSEKDAYKHFVDSISIFLPSVRIILAWIRESKFLLKYSQQNLKFVAKLAFILNGMYSSVSSNAIFAHRVPRLCFFKEDIELQGFKPLKGGFKDFKDDIIHEPQWEYLRIQGKVPDVDTASTVFHITHSQSRLRVFAIGWLGQRILFSNSFGIKFVNGLFNLKTFEDAVFAGTIEKSEQSVKPEKALKIAKRKVSVEKAEKPSKFGEKKLLAENASISHIAGKTHTDKKVLRETPAQAPQISQKTDSCVSIETIDSEARSETNSVVSSNSSVKEVAETQFTQKLDKALRNKDYKTDEMMESDIDFSNIVENLFDEEDDDLVTRPQASVSASYNNTMVTGMSPSIGESNSGSLFGSVWSTKKSLSLEELEQKLTPKVSESTSLPQHSSGSPFSNFGAFYKSQIFDPFGNSGGSNR